MSPERRRLLGTTPGISITEEDAAFLAYLEVSAPQDRRRDGKDPAGRRPPMRTGGKGILWSLFRT